MEFLLTLTGYIKTLCTQEKEITRLYKQAALGKAVKSGVYFLGILASLLCIPFPLSKAHMAHKVSIFILHQPLKGPMTFYPGSFKLKKKRDHEKGHKGMHHYRLNVGPGGSGYI